MSKERYWPFSNGTQWCDWSDRNCDRCTKHVERPELGYHCRIERAIDEAKMGDGSMSRRMAERLGWTPWLWTESGLVPYVWDCPERTLTA